MPLSADELIEKSKDQWKRKRYEEALISAQAAADAEPDSADAWWRIALSRWSMDDARNAVPALRKLLELAPGFGAGWARLGSALLKTGGGDEEARASFMTALELDDENIEALEAMSSIYTAEDIKEQDECEISVLKRIEDLSYLDSSQANRIGILYYRSNRYHEAIKYWRINAFVADHPADLFNLGLAYNHPHVSQDADAIDMWRLALHKLPGYESAVKKLSDVLPRMLKLAVDARRQGDTLLPCEQWHVHYMNPFELLNPPDNLQLDDIDPKMLQKLKKVLLHEIDLEEGEVSWMPGIKVDKSRAIGLCDELNDKAKMAFHWHIFSNKPLLEFLTKGAHGHFLVDEHGSHLDTIYLLQDDESGFRDGLDALFVQQYDRVLLKAMEAKNLIVLECLLDGRRWVPLASEDQCFASARRVVDRLMQPLRDANQKADEEKPSVAVLERILEAGALVGVLNLLPNYFEDFQNEVVQQIRGIAISCFNSHNDIELSRQVIDLAKRFHFRSELVNQQILEDVKLIGELIRKERQHEVQLNRGSEKWAITKEGALLGDSFISVADISSIRWGALITSSNGEENYDFLVNIGGNDGRRINYSWSTTSETSQKYFQDLINAAMHYLFPSVIDRIERRLAKGRAVCVGPCKVTNEGVEFEVKGWILRDTRLVPWPRVLATIENGEITVQDSMSAKSRVSFSLRNTDNAPVLRILADIKGKQKE